MNKKIDAIIKNYLNSSKKTDYAIMINGEWGCGKTYYVEHDVKKLCEDNTFKYIYISLSGCDDFGIINSKITYRLLLDISKIGVDSDFIDNVVALGFELSKSNIEINGVLGFINKIKNIISKEKGKSNTEDYIL